ncbi:MAG: hypothetical protein ABL958_21550 [Bdellovibrionia bacterium]
MKLTSYFLISIALAACATPRTEDFAEAIDNPRRYVFEGIDQERSKERTPAAAPRTAGDLVAEFDKLRTVFELDSMIRRLSDANGPTDYFDKLPDSEKVAAAELLLVGALRGLRPRLEQAAKDYKFKADDLIKAMLGIDMDKFNRIPVVRSYLDGVGLPKTRPFGSPGRFVSRLADVYMRLRNAASLLERIPDGNYPSVLCAFGCLPGRSINRSRAIGALAETNARVAFLLAYRFDGLFLAIKVTEGKILEAKPLTHKAAEALTPPKYTAPFAVRANQQVSDTWLRNAHQHLRQAVAYQEHYERFLAGEKPLNPTSEKRFELQHSVLRERTDFAVSPKENVQVELISFYYHAPDDLKKFLGTKFSSRGGRATEWNAKELNILFPTLNDDRESAKHLNAFLLYWPGGVPFPLNSFLRTR